MQFTPDLPHPLEADAASSSELEAAARGDDETEWSAELEAAMPSARLAVYRGEWHGVDDATLTRAISEAAGIETAKLAAGRGAHP